jgi:hypothetical protein
MTLLVGMEVVMNADTNTDTNTAMRMRFHAASVSPLSTGSVAGNAVLVVKLRST